jgi:hypothetical protein
VSLAICVRCGNDKRRPAGRCSRCGFLPASDEEKAKALILSLDYEIDGPSARTPAGLREIGGQIAAGSDYAFDPEEVRRVIAHAKTVFAVPRSRMLLDLVRWLAIPLLALAAVLWLLSR